MLYLGNDCTGFSSQSDCFGCSTGLLSHTRPFLGSLAYACCIRGTCVGQEGGWAIVLIYGSGTSSHGNLHAVGFFSISDTTLVGCLVIEGMLDGCLTIEGIASQLSYLANGSAIYRFNEEGATVSGCYTVSTLLQRGPDEIEPIDGL